MSPFTFITILFFSISILASPVDPTEILVTEDAYNYFEPVKNPGKSEGQLIPIPGYPSENRPNVLIIITDDQPRGLMGFERPNDSHANKTPNLDKLAHEGVVLDRMYLPIGQCGPSRATMWTGLLPHQHKVVTNNLALSTKYKTLPDYMHEAGYYSGFFGKCHLAPRNEVSRHARGFDQFIWSDNMGKDMMNPKMVDARAGEKQYRNRHITAVLTDLTIQFLDKAKEENKPFFIWLSHRAPHPNVSMSDDYKPMYPPAPEGGGERYPRAWIDQIPSLTPGLAYDPKTQSPSLDPLKTAAEPVRGSPSRRLVAQRGSSVIRDELHSVYSHVNYIDEQTGRVLEHLRNSGQLDDTIILFVADNGRFLGERGMIRKGPFFYDQIVRVPGIVRYPKELKPHVNSSFLYSPDIMPTLLQGIGFQLQSDIVGKSFWSVLKEQKTVHRDSIMLTYTSQITDPKNYKTPMRGLLWKHYKWTQYLPTTYWSSDVKSTSGKKYDGLDFEFFDLEKDPLEINNLLARQGPKDNALQRILASDLPLKNTLIHMRRLRAEWQHDTQDPMALPISKFTISSHGEEKLLKWQTAKPATAELLLRPATCLDCAADVVEVHSRGVVHQVSLPVDFQGASIEVYVYEANGNGNRCRVDLLKGVCQ